MQLETAVKQFGACGISLDEPKFRKLEQFRMRLTETNRHMNLTAITEDDDVWEKHFLDSAMLLKYVQFSPEMQVIDVGTGAGFPGIVLAILQPEVSFLLLDSLQKRVDFLEQTAAEMALSNVRCVHARAEDAGRDPQFREKFDVATARAVAALPVLAEYCLPFVRVGGIFAAMKGPAESEKDAAAAASLGGIFRNSVEYTLPTAGIRKIISMEKQSETPPKYPRRGDKIRKNPLG